MNVSRRVLPLLLAMVIPCTAFAALRDIRTDRLPQDAAVQQAYSDLQGVESMVSAWTNSWDYATPKQEVVLIVKSALDRLSKAAAASPDNEELQLLTGLAAHYAYNLDIEGSFDLAVKSLNQAHQLDARDYRSQWFLANHQCQSTHFNEGMAAFLSLEKSMPWEKIPAAFWNDYAYCATITAMPQHVLRAVDHSTKLDPSPSQMRDFLADNSRKRLRPTTSEAAYPVREVWSAEETGDLVTFTSSICGMRFAVPSQWKAQPRDVKNASCIFYLETSPSPGKAGAVYPSILVIAHQASKGETLDAFVKSIGKSEAIHATSPLVCPAEACTAFEGGSAEMYKQEGGGHFLVTAFQRPAPQYPGLVFEEPSGPAIQKSPAVQKSTDESVHYYHPQERYLRFEGTMFYLVVLDSADSVLPKARQELESFLKTVQVE